jgi:uncharacterized DUF497 family protein
MTFEWDERKRIKNLAKHGIDFVDVPEAFEDRSAITYRSAVSSGEERFLQIGRVDFRVIAVVFVRRGMVLRIISAKRARRDERRRYEDQKS